MTAMPMFPLGMVLLPGGLLPLHVFEPRYRDMVRDCLRADGEPEFGQVLITRGREAGGGDERSMAGTVARIVQMNALDEDRYALVAAGTRRIRVRHWLADDPYPIADIEDWPDVSRQGSDSDIRREIDAAQQRIVAMSELAAELGDGRPDPVDVDLADDPVLASYQLATLAPIGPADRYRLLVAEGPPQRLGLLDQILDDVEAMLKFRLS